MSPRLTNDGTVEWRVPLGNGAVVHIALEDCGKYVRWMFDNAFSADGKAGRAAGIDLAVATEHVRYEDVAKAFKKVTGKPARFVNVSEDEYWASMPHGFKTYRPGQEYSGMRDDDGSIMAFQENFTGFWRMWQASGGSDPLIKRDYALLDEILPDRIRSVEEFFERNKEKCLAVAEGKIVPVIKRAEDMQKKATTAVSKLS